MVHSDSPARFPSLPGRWLHPDWQGYTWAFAACSLAQDVTGENPWGTFNTADHVGDDPTRVALSRERLAAALALPYPPLWLDQVHGNDVVKAAPDTPRQSADGVYTNVPGLPITIHTADCLPLFLVAEGGDEIALAHGGWRGLAAGIIPATLAEFSTSPRNLHAWMGPAIGPTAFEVGDEVRDTFLSADSGMAAAFHPGALKNGQQHWWCDLYFIARRQLRSAGVLSIHGGDECTYTDQRFFSHRRNPKTGRMLSLMWIPPTA